VRDYSPGRETILSRSPSPALRSASAATALQPSGRGAAAANNLNIGRQRLEQLIKKSETGRGLSDEESIEVVALKELFNTTPPSRSQNNSERRQVSGRADSLQNIRHEFELIRDIVTDKTKASKLTISKLLDLNKLLEKLRNILWESVSNSFSKEEDSLCEDIDLIKYTITELIKKLQEINSRTSSERRPTAEAPEISTHNNNAQLAEAIRQSKLLSNPANNERRLLNETGLAAQQSGELKTSIYANNYIILRYFYFIITELTRSIPSPMVAFSYLGEFIKRQLAHIKLKNFTFTLNRTVGEFGDMYQFFRFVNYNSIFCYEPQYLNQTCAVSTMNNLLGLPLFTHDTRTTKMFIDFKINLPVLLQKLSTDFDKIYKYTDLDSTKAKICDYLDKLIDLGELKLFNYNDNLLNLKLIFTKSNFDKLKKTYFQERRNFDYEVLKNEIDSIQITNEQFILYKAKIALTSIGDMMQTYEVGGNYDASIFKLFYLPEFNFDMKVILGEDDPDLINEIPKDTENLIGFFIRFGSHYMCIKRFNKDSFLLLNSLLIEHSTIPFICHGNYKSVCNAIQFIFEKNKRLITDEYRRLTKEKSELTRKIASDEISNNYFEIYDFRVKMESEKNTRDIQKIKDRESHLLSEMKTKFREEYKRIDEITKQLTRFPYVKPKASAVYAVFFKDNGISQERGSSRA
jgi:hypothetical protein